ncbi:MAG TPA: GWxTD domain-containing protein [Bryobacteraceae bacterium]|nr:GWxTD domain-containing protein [Bryobacteraceae bacterium]
MRILEALVASPLAGAAGWAILHSLWEGAIVAALLGAALMMLRSPRARYSAACLAMLAIAAAFAVTLVRMLPDASAAAPYVKAPGFPGWAVRPVTAGGAWPADLAAIVPWLAPLWIAGVWVFYLGQAAGWASAYRMRRRGVCYAPADWQQAVVRLSARLRLTRPVMLLESSLAEAPAVLGHLRPVILVPAGVLAGLPPAQMEAILLHELAHITRHDYLANMLQRAVEGLFFYHPATWWISRVIRAERENCCDDVAVAVSGDAHEYAVALAALEENRWSGRTPAVAATGGSLVKRIRRLLYPKGPNGAWAPLFATLVIMLTAAATLAAWQSAPQSSTALAQVVPDKASPYQKWLSQDVVYIINDRERAAFLKLTADDERAMFITQFWERRNPTPGSPENAFKQEHYRRIAYANKHFGTASMPGWQTDRGHIYIVYGPPDEIESHLGGTQTQYAHEQWMYHHVEGVGDRVVVTFVDKTGEGDYRLAPGNSQ